MNNINVQKYKHIVQYFWDPEPKNDQQDPNAPIWCLGRKYDTINDNNNNNNQHLHTLPSRSSSERTTSKQHLHTHIYPPYLLTGPTTGSSQETPYKPNSISNDNNNNKLPETTSPPTPTSGTGVSAYGWPEAFLDDFESKIWITYRSNFTPIPKSEDRNAHSSMTLSVRLRSQFVESQGFTSDTGWGCMIRSGQSLLANTLSILLLGRGMNIQYTPPEHS